MTRAVRAPVGSPSPPQYAGSATCATGRRPRASSSRSISGAVRTPERADEPSTVKPTDQRRTRGGPGEDSDAAVLPLRHSSSWCRPRSMEGQVPGHGVTGVIHAPDRSARHEERRSRRAPSHPHHDLIVQSRPSGDDVLWTWSGLCPWPAVGTFSWPRQVALQYGISIPRQQRFEDLGDHVR